MIPTNIPAIRRGIEWYGHRFPEEEAVVLRFLALLKEGEWAFNRERAEGHVTASAWVVDPSLPKTVLIHQRKLGK